MTETLASWSDETIANMVIEQAHELVSTRRGTTGEGLVRQKLIELSDEIDRRKDLGFWSLPQ